MFDRLDAPCHVHNTSIINVCVYPDQRPRGRSVYVVDMLFKRKAERTTRRLLLIIELYLSYRMFIY